MNTIPNSRDAVSSDQISPEMLGQGAKKKPCQENKIQEIEDVNRVIANLEIIEIVRQTLTSDCKLEMNNLNKTYNNLLKNDYEINFKRYLKRLLNETIPGVAFARPLARRSSEKLYSADCHGKAIETYKNNLADFTAIFEAAKIICKQILKH